MQLSLYLITYDDIKWDGGTATHYFDIAHSVQHVGASGWFLMVGYIHIFPIMAQHEGERLSCPGPFNSEGRAPCTHWIGSWMAFRASIDMVAKKIISASDEN